MDSEDSDIDNSPGETKIQDVGNRKVLSNIKSTSKHHHLLINSKDSANNEDSSEDSEDSEDNKKASYSNAFSWLDESNASHFTSSNTEDFDDFDCDNTSIDADVDGTHGHLFLNSQSDDDDDDDDDDEEERDDELCKLSKRRAQIANSRKKSYWNKKRKVDIVETSYCSNSQVVETVETKKYAGYLILGDDNCTRFPDGSHYRLR